MTPIFSDLKIVNISYAIPYPECTDPEAWVKKIGFSTGILEKLANTAEVVAIYHIQYRGELHKNGVAYYFPGFTRWQLLLPFAFNRYVKNLSPDVVIVHGLISPWQVVMLRLLLGKKIKIIAQHHAERPLKNLRALFQRWADSCIDVYLFASMDLGRDWNNRRLIRDMAKVKEVMEASSTFYSLDMNEARKRTGVHGAASFIWVGGLELRKNPEMVVRAFADFLQTKPEARLYMIFQSTELLQAVERLAALHANISLVGHVPNHEMLYWYNSVQYVIASSFYEGSGIAVCEALSCGCLPILTNIPSFRMMTDEGSIGALYEPGDEATLLTTLHKALTWDVNKEKQKVLQQFRDVLSFDAIAARTMTVINDIL